MTDKNKTEPAVTPEAKEQTTQAHEAAPPAANGAAESITEVEQTADALPPPVQDTTPRLYEIQPVTVSLTAQGILGRGAELAAQWNGISAKAQEKRAELAKMHDELAALENGYRGIRLQMRSLVETCEKNELPISDEMRQMVYERDDRGNNLVPVAPPPEAK